MYTVIGTIRSRTLRVLWMLEELGLSYERVDAGPRSDEARAANPLGKVPVLVVDGNPIADSTSILTYLGDRHGQLTFSAGTLERARQDALTHFVLEAFDALLWMASRHSFVLPEEHRLPEIKPSLKWEFEHSQRHAVDFLGDGPFLMGETMTVPDIILAHCLGWAVVAKFPLTEPRLTEYADRLRSRPAFKRAMGRG